MVLWGYAEGSKLARPLMLQVKTGLKEWPELYVMVAHLCVGAVLWTKELIWEQKNHLWVTRYKHAYSIYRPDDERLKLYPKPWITDTKYLSDDHPMKTTDIPFYRLPPVEVHRYDPHIRGPDEQYDGKPPIADPVKIDWTWIPGTKAQRDKWMKEHVLQNKSDTDSK